MISPHLHDEIDKAAQRVYDTGTKYMVLVTPTLRVERALKITIERIEPHD